MTLRSYDHQTEQNKVYAYSISTCSNITCNKQHMTSHVTFDQIKIFIGEILIHMGPIMTQTRNLQIFRYGNKYHYHNHCWYCRLFNSSYFLFFFDERLLLLLPHYL